MKTLDEKRERIEALFSPYLSQEKLTHYFVASSSLRDTVPDFCFSSHNQDSFSYDLASLTKVLVSAPIVLKLFDKDPKIEENFSEFLRKNNLFISQNGLEVTLKSLLEHRSGLPAWKNFWISDSKDMFSKSFSERSFQDRKQRIFDVFSRWEQTKVSKNKTEYSDIGFILLGLFLEEYFQESLDTVLRTFQKDTFFLEDQLLFYPSGQEEASYVPTGFCKLRRRRLRGEVHDENAASLGRVCGHAGVFASGSSLLKYMKALWKNDLKHKVEKQSFLGPLGTYWNGWEISKLALSLNSGLCLRHLGFTGTGLWILPEREELYIILTNRVYSERRSPWIAKLRSETLAVFMD